VVSSYINKGDLTRLFTEYPLLLICTYFLIFFSRSWQISSFSYVGTWQEHTINTWWNWR